MTSTQPCSSSLSGWDSTTWMFSPSVERPVKLRPSVSARSTNRWMLTALPGWCFSWAPFTIVRGSKSIFRVLWVERSDESARDATEREFTGKSGMFTARGDV
uniref:(northern house mosquito) hypothetical protein n=1 Tax=Culex pipiens TaxID=7175 RepID=A0A8D8CHE1_CULPI